MAAKLLKCMFFSLVAGLLILLIIVISCNLWVILTTRQYIYTDTANVPEKKVALVLGTSKYLRSGVANPYFYNRLDTAIELYRLNKVDFILVSGDNSSIYYNETRDMRRYLVKNGIPLAKIIEDFAGFRTLDSVLRAKYVFNLHSFIVVSQKFHNQRAIFIAKANGLDAVAINADMPNNNFKVLLREYFLSRVKAVLDIYVLDTKPKFYQQKENISQLFE